MFKPSIILSPHFVIKYYLYIIIKKITTEYKFTGKILDIGCGEKPYKSLFTRAKYYNGIDYSNYSQNKQFIQEKPDYFFDETYSKTLVLPFSANTFDQIVCFQVLEHHKDPQKLIDEAFRITKKGGMILMSFPLLWGLHEEPHDYFRITHYGIKELLKNHKHSILKLYKQGSIFSSISMLWNDYLASIANKGRIYYFLIIPFFILSLLFSYLSLLFDKIFISDQIFLNYVILIQKN